jgi:hypothetical protein
MVKEEQLTGLYGNSHKFMLKFSGKNITEYQYELKNK